MDKKNNHNFTLKSFSDLNLYSKVIETDLFKKEIHHSGSLFFYTQSFLLGLKNNKTIVCQVTQILHLAQSSQKLFFFFSKF